MNETNALARLLTILEQHLATDQPWSEEAWGLIEEVRRDMTAPTAEPVTDPDPLRRALLEIAGHPGACFSHDDAGHPLDWRLGHASAHQEAARIALAALRPTPCAA